MVACEFVVPGIMMGMQWDISCPNNYRHQRRSCWTNRTIYLSL